VDVQPSSLADLAGNSVSVRTAFLGLIFVPFLARAGEWAKARQCIGPDGKGGLSCLAWNEYPAPGETATWCGAIADGKCEGEGVLEWRKAGELTQRYIGPLRVGKKEGLGAFEWSDGRRYLGGFHANRMHGRGLFRDRAGTRYDGFWLEGKRVSDGEYQAYLDRVHAGASIRDLSLAGIRLQDFFQKYEGKLGTPAVEEYSVDAGDLQKLTFPGVVVELFAPWGKGQGWVVHSVEVKSGPAKTARGVGLGDASLKVLQVYGNLTVRYETATGLVAYGNWAYLSFGVERDGPAVRAITLGTNNEGQAGEEEP
jgi:hypothetical protein